MRFLLFLGSLIFSLSTALACPPSGTTIINGPTICVPNGIANIGEGPHVYTMTSTLDAAADESHEWSIKGGIILSAIGTPVNRSCSRSDRAVTIVEGIGENGIGRCDVLSIAQLNGTSTITVQWDPTVPERSLKCKVKFKGKKASINSEAKLSVLDALELYSLSRTISCSSNDQVWTARTSSTTGCSPMGYNWYINNQLVAQTSSGVYSFSRFNTSGTIDVELNYGNNTYRPRKSSSLALRQDRLEGPSSVSRSGSTFTLVPGELDGPNPTNLQWGCSLSNGVTLTPFQNNCVVDPNANSAGMWGILFVSYIDACGVQRSLQKGFQVSTSFGLNVSAEVNVAAFNIQLNEESTESELELVSSKFELDAQTQAEKDFTFQSPINKGSDLTLHVNAGNIERHVVLTSSVGSIIIQVDLSPGETFLNIPTFELIPGLYFVSIVAPNATTYTKRLLVK